MKVYFFKDNLNNYQIFPPPQNINNVIEIEVKNEAVLDNKQLVKMAMGIFLLIKSQRNYTYGMEIAGLLMRRSKLKLSVNSLKD